MKLFSLSVVLVIQMALLTASSKRVADGYYPEYYDENQGTEYYEGGEGNVWVGPGFYQGVWYEREDDWRAGNGGNWDGHDRDDHGDGYRGGGHDGGDYRGGGHGGGGRR